MPTSYPSGLDNFTNPASSDYEDVVSHSGQHANANDAIEAIESTLGTTAGTSVIDNFSAGERAVAIAGTATIKNVDAILDEDDMASDSATALVTQQSVKAYVDTYGKNHSLYRQAIINGNFDVWQRGTSFSSAGYTADRWRNTINGSANTITRQSFTVGQTDVPNNPVYFIRNTVVTSAGASNLALLTNRIESVKTLAGMTATLSFWAKADSAKNIAVEVEQNFGSGGSPSSSVFGIVAEKKALTTSWQQFTVTITVPSISGKTLGTTNDGWLGVNLWFDAGSDFNARTDSLGQQSGTFDIAQVELNAGSVALPFMPKSYEEELAACQRYCLQLGGNALNILCPAYLYTSTVMRGVIHFPVSMRTGPSLTTSTVTSDNYQGILIATAKNASAVSVANATTLSCNVDYTISSSSTTGDGGYLTVRNSSNFILDAEL